jgi:hypothetical protein
MEKLFAYGNLKRRRYSRNVLKTTAGVPETLMGYAVKKKNRGRIQNRSLTQLLGDPKSGRLYYGILNNYRTELADRYEGKHYNALKSNIAI